MTETPRTACILAIICLAWVLIPCRADPVVVTRAMTASTIIQIHVERESIRTELEIGASNLLAFTELLPDEIFTDLTGRSEPYAQRVESYLRDQFVIEADGKPLVGEIESLEIRKRRTSGSCSITWAYQRSISATCRAKQQSISTGTIRGTPNFAIAIFGDSSIRH